MIITPEATIPDIDALIVLGRGIEADGSLSPTSEHRAHVVAQLVGSSALTDIPIVFSGGRSWRQVAAGQLPPSEGGSMLQHALRLLDYDMHGNLLSAEEESTSTVENFVNSAWKLGVTKGNRLGVLSDPLHFRYGRPEYISKIVLPGVEVVRMELPEVYTPTKDEISEEHLSTLATKAIMLGVARGNSRAIMRRQRALEFVNRLRSDPFHGENIPTTR